MNKAILTVITLFCAASTVSSATALPYADSVMFYRVDSDERAIKLVDEGLLDMYYHNVPAHLLERFDSLDVYTNPAGTTFTILLNPAQVEEFNPFSITEVRFAVNYIIDRKDVVSQLFGGYGFPTISPYTPIDPDYAQVLNQTTPFGIQYNLTTAKTMVHTAMTKTGATLENDVWVMDGKPIIIKSFIQIDDPILFSIGNTLAFNLEDMGFVVKRVFGDLDQALDVVYESNPGDLNWHVYIEVWDGGFSQHDDRGLTMFYAPWSTNMPGSNNPEFWSYENESLDRITRTVYNGEYSSEDERTQLLQEALSLGLQEAVRVFVTTSHDIFVVNKDVTGVINSAHDGIINTLTLNNAQPNGIILRVGMKHLGQSSWNPVAGYGDAYSNQLVDPLIDPSAISHPHTGDVIPVRVEHSVNTAGPHDTLEVPSDAITWNPYIQRWTPVGSGTTAISVVTMDYTLSNWHHGIAVDMQDILFGVYFIYEWGTSSGIFDSTRDSEYTTTTEPFLEHTLVAVRPLDDDTLEVYVNYWHPDGDEIGARAMQWTNTPWELFFAMEQIVKDGKAAFSLTESADHNVPWLSVIDNDDVDLIRQYLEQFANSTTIPKTLDGLEASYYVNRYMAAMEWIDRHGHAEIGHGPFYLLSYDDERGLVFIREFKDGSYPYETGRWSHLTEPAYPDIATVEFDGAASDESFTINVHSTGADLLRYFLMHEDEILYTDEILSTGTDNIIIPLDERWACPASLLLVAASDNLIIPDVYSTDVVADICIHPVIYHILHDLTESERTELLDFMLYLLDSSIDEISTTDADAYFTNPKLNHASLTIFSLILDDEVSARDIHKLILDYQ